MVQIKILTDTDLRQVENKINNFLTKPEVRVHIDTKMIKEQELYIAVVVYERRIKYVN